MAATNNPEKRLGEKIREMRLKKGMTQKRPVYITVDGSILKTIKTILK